MIQHTPSIICDFHLPVDFKLRHVGDEEKTIPSCLDTSSPMMAPPVLPLQSAFCALQKTDWLKLDRFKLFGLDILSAESEC